jgi:dipeptidase E
MNILSLSSSRVGNGGFLEKAIPLIQKFIGSKPLNIAFIPFASVQRSDEDYGNMVKEALHSVPYSINTATGKNAATVIQNADAIMVGGGNTFKLLHDLYKQDLLELIRERVKGGTYYIGWSAGANIAGRTISTTNDMPIIQPQSFASLAFFPFQINPHYINQSLEGHNGETRDQRLEEFIVLNPDVPVVGLPEGTALQMQRNTIRFIGDKEGVLFQNEKGLVKKRKVAVNEDLSRMLD